MRPIRLHLGCGQVHIPGYVNADIQFFRKNDLVCDAYKLPFADNSLEVLYACALIEHLGRDEWMDALREWHRVLCPGGLVQISTADFQAVCDQYLETGSLDGLYGLVVGGQRDAYDWHGMVFDFDTLRAGLEGAGFAEVHRYDWKDTIVGLLGVDDFSQAYLPHMDKEGGRLMSLNVEARA